MPDAHNAPAMDGFDDRCGGRKHSVPIAAGVVATPQAIGPGVDAVCAPWIEAEKVHRRTQVEHAPAAAAVVRDIRASHVAGYQHGVAVMRADGGKELCASPARADDSPSAWAGSAMLRRAAVG